MDPSDFKWPFDLLNDNEASELRQLALSRGYLVAYKDDAMFLRWPEKEHSQHRLLVEALEERGVQIETIFKPFHPFDYSHAVFQFDELDDPWSRTLALSPRVNFLRGRTSSALKHGSFSSIYKQIIEQHSLQEKVSMEKVPALAGLRDIMENQLRRNGELIMELAREVEAMLKVWICEGILLHSSDDIFDNPPDLVLCAGTIREEILTGQAGYLLQQRLEELLFLDYVPDVIKKAQSAGLQAYAQQIEKIANLSVDLNLRRLAYETIIHAAVLDKPLPGEPPPTLPHHGNSVFLPFKEDITALWVEVKDDRTKYPSEKKVYDYIFTPRYKTEIAPKVNKSHGYDAGVPSYSLVRGYADDLRPRRKQKT